MSDPASESDESAPADAEPVSAEPAGAEPAGAEPAGVESAGVEPVSAESASAEQAKPTEVARRRVRRTVQGTLLLFGWGLLLAVAFARRSNVLVGGREDSFAGEHWALVAFGGSLPCLALAVWIATTAPAAARPSPPRSFAGALARGLSLAALLCGALSLYLLCGGHDVLYFYPWTPVGNAAFLAPLLGLLSVLEGMPAARLRAQLGWSLVAGLSGVVALLVAWTQREYANAVFTEGQAEATAQLLKTFEWLTVDPLWTLHYFAWVAAPVGALTFARLRPRGERTLFALAVSGTVLPWFMPWTRFADAVIVTAAGLICLLTSPAFRLGDFLHAKATAKLLGREDEA